jgi:hypothetical protein
MLLIDNIILKMIYEIKMRQKERIITIKKDIEETLTHVSNNIKNQKRSY